RRSKHRGGQSAFEEPLSPYWGCELLHPGGSSVGRRLRDHSARSGSVRMALLHRRGGLRRSARHAVGGGEPEKRRCGKRSQVIREALAQDHIERAALACLQLLAETE